MAGYGLGHGQLAVVRVDGLIHIAVLQGDAAAAHGGVAVICSLGLQDSLGAAGGCQGVAVHLGIFLCGVVGPRRQALQAPGVGAVLRPVAPGVVQRQGGNGLILPVGHNDLEVVRQGMAGYGLGHGQLAVVRVAGLIHVGVHHGQDPVCEGICAIGLHAGDPAPDVLEDIVVLRHIQQDLAALRHVDGPAAGALIVAVLRGGEGLRQGIAAGGEPVKAGRTICIRHGCQALAAAGQGKGDACQGIAAVILLPDLQAAGTQVLRRVPGVHNAAVLCAGGPEAGDFLLTLRRHGAAVDDEAAVAVQLGAGHGALPHRIGDLIAIPVILEQAGKAAGPILSPANGLAVLNLAVCQQLQGNACRRLAVHPVLRCNHLGVGHVLGIIELQDLACAVIADGGRLRLFKAVPGGHARQLLALCRNGLTGLDLAALGQADVQLIVALVGGLLEIILHAVVLGGLAVIAQDEAALPLVIGNAAVAVAIAVIIRIGRTVSRLYLCCAGDADHIAGAVQVLLTIQAAVAVVRRLHAVIGINGDVLRNDVDAGNIVDAAGDLLVVDHAIRFHAAVLEEAGRHPDGPAICSGIGVNVVYLAPGSLAPCAVRDTHVRLDLVLYLVVADGLGGGIRMLAHGLEEDVIVIQLHHIDGRILVQDTVDVPADIFLLQHIANEVVIAEVVVQRYGVRFIHCFFDFEPQGLRPFLAVYEGGSRVLYRVINMAVFVCIGFHAGACHQLGQVHLDGDGGGIVPAGTKVACVIVAVDAFGDLIVVAVIDLGGDDFVLRHVLGFVANRAGIAGRGAGSVRRFRDDLAIVPGMGLQHPLGVGRLQDLIAGIAVLVLCLRAGQAVAPGAVAVFRQAADVAVAVRSMLVFFLAAGIFPAAFPIMLPVTLMAAGVLPTAARVPVAVLFQPAGQADAGPAVPVLFRGASPLVAVTGHIAVAVLCLFTKQLAAHGSYILAPPVGALHSLRLGLTNDHIAQLIAALSAGQGGHAQAGQQHNCRQKKGQAFSYTLCHFFITPFSYEAMAAGLP